LVRCSATDRRAPSDGIGIFQYPVSAYVDKADQTDASSTPTDLRVYFHAREGPWYTIKTGTEAGSAEGSVYGSAQLRNLFGGAESLHLHAARGTRTRSVYSAAFEAPVRGDPNLRVELHGVKSAALKPWSSHEELQGGGGARVKWAPDALNRHEVGYGATWRRVTGLGSGAAPAVRMAAGDSLKSALSWSWTRDARDSPLLPERGLLLRSAAELAGAGPLGGDVGFARVEAEAQAAVPVPLPRVAGPSGVAVNLGLRAGLLCPLAAGGAAAARPSILPDRFTLGGPTDVRGFRMAGLGPHEGGDALGGDAYAAGGASVLVPLPRAGRDVPLRLQAFVNAGRLVALNGGEDGAEGPALEKPGATWASVKRTVADLRRELPSTAAGVGLVYAHPMARFELNFSLPLFVRRDELARKGIQFGIGVTFL
jgi:outer membrane protein insertion porin family